MMNKGISKLKILTLSILLLVCPFSINPHTIKAESVGGSSPIIGVNITVIDREYGQRPYQGTVTLTTDMTRWQCVSGSSSGCNVWRSQNTSDVVQDDITGTITYSNSSVWDVMLYQYEFVLDDDYVGNVTFNNTSIGGTTTQTYYINGTNLTLTSTQLISSFTISNYSLIKKTSDNFMWMFPIESFNIINQQFENNYSVVEYLNNAQYIFPVFSVSNGNRIARIWSNAVGRDYYFIFGMNVNLRMPNYADVISFTNCEVTNIEELYYSSSMIIKKFYLKSTASGVWVDANILSNKYYMPIYLQDTSAQEHASTDFSLNYGLTNPLMRNIEKIANGTTSSNESAADNDSATDDLVSASDSLFNQENSFNNSMNSNLENIDTSNVLGAMGSKFSSSANWVRVQFNTLTNNTPFGSVLSFSLILGLALLLIGRWRHD